MMYYLTWQEDDWLDEIIDRFPSVMVMVPNGKTLEKIKRERSGEAGQSVLVVNVAYEPTDTETCLKLIDQDSGLAALPLFLVGVEPKDVAAWQAKYPRATVVAIDVHPFEFDYEAVLDQMEAKLGDAS